MKTSLDLGKHHWVVEDGVFEVQYDGDVEEHEARQLLSNVMQWSVGTHTVWVTDVTKLGNFTPGARKVFSAPAPGVDPNQETHTHLFVVGAGIKTKAVLSLVFAATRLMGKMRYQVQYTNDLEEGRRLGREKMRSLIEAGLAKLPPEV